MKSTDELEMLKQRLDSLKELLDIQKKNEKKVLCKRNYKIFKSTCNFLAPVIITASLTIGGFRLLGFGLPFHVDKTTKYKLYNLTSGKNGYVTIDESYRDMSWNFGKNKLPASKLIIYTPWEYFDTEYIRYKRVYELNGVLNRELFDAIIKKDYRYVENNIRAYHEQQETALEISNDNDYIIEADLYLLDKNDTLVYKETTMENTIETSIEFLCFIMASMPSLLRWPDYAEKLKQINSQYYFSIEAKDKTIKNIVETNNKILLLKKMK